MLRRWGVGRGQGGPVLLASVYVCRALNSIRPPEPLFPQTGCAILFQKGHQQWDPTMQSLLQKITIGGLGVQLRGTLSSALA